MKFYIITSKLELGQYRQEIVTENEKEFLEDIVELTRTEFGNVSVDEVEISDEKYYDFLVSTG